MLIICRPNLPHDLDDNVVQGLSRPSNPELYELALVNDQKIDKEFIYFDFIEYNSLELKLTVNLLFTQQAA